MLEAVAMMGGLGLIVGAGLGVASKLFYVYVDPLIEAVEGALPGANCGGCGLPGCSANAQAIVAGKASPTSCVAGGPDIAGVIAGILGVSVEAKEPDIARPGCYYGVQDADLKYEYAGLTDCRAMALLGGGTKVCTIGCLGLGTCARACPFDAITMGPDNLPVVDPVKCTGCGTCERVCPKHIINLSSVTRRILREYTTEECTTPCQRACPAGINIREYIRQVQLGNPHQAVQVIKERNPFPAVIGRICPRPCEEQCRRKYVDEPVAINFIKRYAADCETAGGQIILPFKAPASGRKVAVVGGGVEGLSTAFFTARLGHEVTVFEATDLLGGLLRSAIATLRLPQEVLDRDIEGILQMGVTAQTGQTLGKDFTMASLLSRGFEAVFLASGGWDSRLARGGLVKPESPIPGASLLIDFVRFASKDAGLIGSGDVVIAGGGKLALQAARICKEQGAGNITLLLRESWEQSPFSDADVTQSGLEDMRILHHTGLNRIFGEGDRLREVEVVDLENRSFARIPAGSLVLASGRFPEMIFVPEKQGENNGGARILWVGAEPYKKPFQKDEIGVFSEGDALTDYSAAIRAIGAGRKASASIHQIMYGISPTLPDRVITPDAELQDVYEVERVPGQARQIMPACGPAESACRELEKGYTPDAARAEAFRCLQCGLICYEHEGNLEAHRATASARE